jgi:hypothetical protein
LAGKIGINGGYIKTASETLVEIGKDSDKANLFKIAPESIFNRTEEVAAIIQAFYEKTREVADKYYGRSFLVSLPVGELYAGHNASGVGAGTTLNFRYGYKVVDAAYDENTPAFMQKAGSEVWRTNDNKTRAMLDTMRVGDLQNSFVIAHIPSFFSMKSKRRTQKYSTFSYKSWTMDV